MYKKLCVFAACLILMAGSASIAHEYQAGTSQFVSEIIINN